MKDINLNKVIALSILSIEMTRRCNMNCDFCSRGKAQSIDITPEIIDKTLDEVKGYYIDCLRLNGGEPFLNADMIEYLVDSIIEKHIMIGRVCIFTNGTIKNEKIKDSLYRLHSYLLKIETMRNYYLKLLSDELNVIYVTNYKVNEENTIHIIISDKYHDRNEKINDFICFYSMNTPTFEVVKQSQTLIHKHSCIHLSGNTLINHKKILKNNINVIKCDVRTVINEYNFIKENSNVIHLEKTLTVSANGNVFVGCLQSYDKVDNNPMFNILDCNNDFIDKVYNWCWEHPITEPMNNFREREESKKWLISNGYTIIGKEPYLLLCNEMLINKFESIMKRTHNLYKALTITEVEEMAIYLICLDYIEIEKKKPYYQYKYLFAFLMVNFKQLRIGLEDIFFDYFINENWLKEKISIFEELNQVRINNINPYFLINKK